MKLILILLLSSYVYSSALQKGEFIINTDISYTSARELWKGNSEKVSFQDGSKTHADGTLMDAGTRFYNYGIEAMYGTGFWGIEADLRLDYTASKMLDASHADTKEGQSVKQISNIALKLKKDLYHGKRFSLGSYFYYRHPGRTAGQKPVFISVNDFSQHYTLGLYTSYNITSKFFNFTDLNYTTRSKAKGSDTLEDLDLPADQFTLKTDFLYAYDSKLSFGFGALWKHTMSGLDISTPSFGPGSGASLELGHPPFYAARERFMAHTVYFNYYINPKSWVGLSHFEKFWGRNTDVSRTITLFAGRSF